MRRLALALLLLAAAPAAHAAFPYAPQNGNGDFKNFRLPAGSTPGDLQGKLQWMYSATPEPGGTNTVNDNTPGELGGVRGAHIVDASAGASTAWQKTTGRPDVTIAVLDSGFKWNDAGAVNETRKKMRLNKGELPQPKVDRSGTSLEGDACSGYTEGGWDTNGDSVFNVVDYACDNRVQKDPAARGGKGQGPANVLDPQDVLIAFTDDTDGDDNGFKDDIVGWDFLDDDNDPYDDVQYGHGTGEAQDSGAEANNGGDSVGTCPNCMIVPLRVGTSFIADVNRFAQASIYAADNGIDVIQEALGTLNNSHIARSAVDYAYDHGVTVIASAADEAAQHHNWPSTLPHVIVVNSITKYTTGITAQQSYLQFNGCTNFMTKITVGIPSVSCSSDAAGRGAGMAGLIYSAALNAHDNGLLPSHPTSTCRRTDGSACVISPNEVRQLMASGTVDGAPNSDDVNFATVEGSCTTAATVACLDPNLNSGLPSDRLLVSPLANTKRYPTRKGFDETFGYGRVNMDTAVSQLIRGSNPPLLPPEVEIDSPEWYDQVDPGQADLAVRARIGVRAGTYTCEVQVAPGSQPNNAATTASPAGDFKTIPSSHCDGSTARSGDFSGEVARIDIADLKSRFPAGTDFAGRESGTAGQSSNGRPNSEPYGFTIRIVAKRTADGKSLTGEDRRNLWLHRDQDMLSGFPRHLQSDGASSPVLVDLDGDNRNELIVATSDGVVHAYERDGSEAAGAWPVHDDALPLHNSHAISSGAISDFAGGAILASVAAADIDHDGSVEVVAADMEGKVYVWDSEGHRVQSMHVNFNHDGHPLSPFADERRGHRNRTQRGFIGSPVLADLDKNDGGKLEIVAAAMDRHLYAWNDDGSEVPGYPVLVVDPSKVASIDPQTDQVRFNANAGADQLDSGAIIDTPAVGDIDQPADGKPEVVVGTNEEYAAGQGDEGPYNSSQLNATTPAVVALGGGLNLGGLDNPLDLGLASGNTRLYALHGDGTAHAGGNPIRWKAKLGLLQPNVLPLVGEGVTGSPAIGPVTCPSGGAGQAVLASGAAGPAYVFNRDGQSCIGQTGGADIPLATDASAGSSTDHPSFAAFSHGAFGNFGGGVSAFIGTTGLMRALDIVAPEYQGGQDSVTGWNPNTGQGQPGFPAEVNDLQFLTGPSVGDINSTPGEEVLEASASMDLAAYGVGGTPADASKWPKLTGDWAVANPTLGSFGTLDTDSDAKRSVIALTRGGLVLGYGTPAAACAPASWPRFHHDNANSGYYDRDAVSPGKPTSAAVADSKIAFKAPGDDLLCGNADHYELAQSDNDPSPSSFDEVDGVTPAAPGSAESLPLAAQKRYVAVRAVDEQGNVGLAAVVDTAPTAPPSGGGGGADGGQNGGNEGQPGSGGGSGEGGSAPGQGGSTPGGSAPGPDRPLEVASRKLRLHGRFVLARIKCPSTAKGSCRGAVGLLIGRKRVSASRLVIAPGKKGTVRLRLSRRTIARLRRRHALAAKLAVVASDSAGHSFSVTRSVTLKP